jgi:hypothetical protein
MKAIKTDIIPQRPFFIGEQKSLDKKAICIFAATGFFLDQDTYYNELRVLKPGCDYLIDTKENRVISESPYFKWHYNPIDRSLKQIVEEFTSLFETIIKDQVSGKQVILPLSGGLDSRTQAAALCYLGIPVQSYGYAFKGGHRETKYGKRIAKVCGFPFEDRRVGKGYLWEAIDKLAKINACYSEFTNPRQMAIIDEYGNWGDVFSLGHWGDVLFDDMGVSDDLSTENQIKVLLKKIVVKGGMALASSLWKSFQLEGEFKDYLKNRIQVLLEEINITDNANAQIRAFKSKYWAPRWTSINLSVFESVKPITLPYYDNRMCEFICSVPEKYLAGRQIQIEYLKRRMPELAKITWEAQRPFNLYNYHRNKVPWNIPFRIFNKFKRTINPNLFIQRNWELQFLGTENDQKLRERLFNNSKFAQLIDPEVIGKYYKLFKEGDAVYYSHPVSMLLTLSVFSENLKKN